ncbi:MAG: hypothetical protein HY298_16945 [Verrucomicrobia bacterium]|nr:hypothetical protein [Verrucomicrobiota bacterium]
MKTSPPFATLLLLLSLLRLAAQPVPSSDAAFDQPASFTIAAREANSQLLQRVTWSTNDDHEVSATTNVVTQIETGLNYQDPNSGEWLPSEETVELLPGGTGAVARKAQHTVFFPPSLYNGVITLTTPEGTILRSRPTMLSFFDGQKSVLIGELKDSMGYLLPSKNQIIFPDTFTDGIHADVILTFTKSGFEADLVFRKPLPVTPEQFGLRPESCRIQLLTEFFDTVAPEKESESISPNDRLSDSVLRFGTMRMIAGKGFLVGNPAAEQPALPVFKNWQVLENRSFLVEEVPWQKIEPQLKLLAVAASPRVKNFASTDANTRRASTRRLLPPSRLSQPTTNTIQLAKVDVSKQPGFILDYTIVSSATNQVFQGDTTYYVSGAVTLSGTTKIEGGAVVKFTNTSVAKITINGAIQCQTSAYRPAIFTAKDDNTVGETITGSTGSPTNYYGNGLYITSSSNSLSNVRLAYASYALYFYHRCSGWLNLTNVQFVKCRYPLYAEGTDVFCMDYESNVNLNNVLGYACDTFISGQYIYLKSRNVTVHGCNTLGSVQAGDGSYGYWTNGLLVGVTNWGNMYYGTNNTAYFATDPGNIFQTVGAGSHYLADNSPYRNAGTTNITASLLAELKKKTTYPPILLTNTVSVDTTLVPQAQRDTDTPDLGFHFDPIDFITWVYTVTNATLTISNGAAIACYNDNGIWLQDGSAIISVGTPLLPNWFVRYQLVQEQPVALGAYTPSSAVTVNPYHTGAVHQAASFRFSNFSAPANGGTQLYDGAPNWLYSNLFVQDCQIWGGANTFSGGNSTTVIVNNNLFYRSSFSASGSFTNSSLSLSNNLFVGLPSKIILVQPAGCVWNAFNNVFDTCWIGPAATCTNGYNAYINSTNRISPTNVNDIVLTNALGYQSGPLGDFYQPTNSSLINAGSVTNAGWVGLYHYTVTTNQVKEASSTVDIGFHYVAVTNGVPIDTDSDGMPDYLEDANGNGTVNSGETDWQSATDLGLKVLITRPRNGSTIP